MSHVSAAPTGAADRIPLRIILALGATGLPLAGLLLAFGIFLPRFYVAHGVSFAAVGAAIGLVRVLDVMVDPVVGMAMDQTNTPFGRYRPWLLAGTPILMLGAYMLFLPPFAVTQLYLIFWLFLAYVGNSMLTLGLAAWQGNLAAAYHERSRVYGITQAMAVFGSTLLLLLPQLSAGHIRAGDMGTITKILLVAVPVCVLISVFFSRERKVATSAQHRRMKWSDFGLAITNPSMRRIILADLALTLGPGTTGPIYIYFFHDAKEFSIAQASTLLVFYILAGLFGAPAWAKVAQKFGKHRTVQIACVCYGISQTVLMAIPKAVYLPTALGMFVVGFCSSAFLLLVRAMVADVADEVRLERGQDLTSVLYSMVTTTQKIGTAISVAIIFPVLQMVGYNGAEGAVNTPEAIFGLEMCYLFAPIILVFFGGAAFFGYRLNEARHGEIRAELDAREAADLAAAEESLVGPTGATADAR